MVYRMLRCHLDLAGHVRSKRDSSSLAARFLVAVGVSLSVFGMLVRHSVTMNRVVEADLVLSGVWFDC